MSNNLTAREVQNFKQLARVNTGSHMLDSGGAYGRQHEKPDIGDDTPLVTASLVGDIIDYLLVNTAVHLDNVLRINRFETERFYRWVDRVDRGGSTEWGDLLEKYCLRRWSENEHGKWEGGYTYNNETSFNQDFTFYFPSEDWDAAPIVVIRMHNGCDARGGFTGPVFADQWCDNLSDIMDTLLIVEPPSCDAELSPTPEDQGELIDRGIIYCYADANGEELPEDWSIRVAGDQAEILCPNGHVTWTVPIQ